MKLKLLFKSNLLLIPGILLAIGITACKKLDQEVESTPCSETDVIDANHSKFERIQQIMDGMVAEGIPGMTIAIMDDEGTWAGASGYAKIEDKTPMEICHLQYGQSLAKTYTAVALLQLAANHQVILDATIDQYLPEDVLDIIENEEMITVRMLLNHTSGIPEYNDKADYITYLLQNPGYSFTAMDYLEFTRGANPKFEPGTGYSYTNTNYVLATIIIDKIVGDHKTFIQENLLIANGLNHTFYHNQGFLDQPEVPNSYWDRYSNRELENCSDMQKTMIKTLVGDDGIIATPLDYTRFLKQLLSGEILDSAELNEMLTYVQKSDENQDGYGLGIHKDYYNGHVEIGHSGGGIGSGCLLGYFPESNTYYFIGMNIGTSIHSPIFDNLQEKIDELYDVLLE